MDQKSVFNLAKLISAFAGFFVGPILLALGSRTEADGSLAHMLIQPFCSWPSGAEWVGVLFIIFSGILGSKLTLIAFSHFGRDEDEEVEEMAKDVVREEIDKMKEKGLIHPTQTSNLFWKVWKKLNRTNT